MTSKEKYLLWSTDDYFDSSTREELLDISGDKAEIEDRFYKNLEFGTGGMRGVIGAGTNRMNVYTVRRASQGCADYFLKNVADAAKRGIAIAYDCRFKSDEFALEAARVFAHNGIKVYLFESLRPTPELSFAVRHLKAAGGVVVTASHNPPKYNGYKVYGDDGGQFPPDESDKAIRDINAIKDITSVKSMDRDEAFKKGLIEIIGKEIDDKYIEAVKLQRIHPEITEKLGGKFNLVYTPLHGTGYVPVTRILKEIGLKNVFVVSEQALPDPAFSTVKSPNPEDREAFKLAIELAKKKDADLIIATDPDADRAGLVVRNDKGEYIALSGNQTGCLLLEYVLSQKHEGGTLPSNGFITTSIVTTNLAAAIAKYYNVTAVEVLTGFKFVGEKIRDLEDNGNMKFIAGFEESYGYLVGTHARDKDAVVTSMLIAEMAAYLYSKGMSVYDALQAIYQKYGYYIDGIKSFTLEGKTGQEKIAAAMEKMRARMPLSFGPLKVSGISDMQAGYRYDGMGEITGNLGFDVSNVLYFDMEDGSWFCIRPSGTEPKIKIYFGASDAIKDSAAQKMENLKEQVLKVVSSML